MLKPIGPVLADVLAELEERFAREDDGDESEADSLLASYGPGDEIPNSR